MQFSFHLKEPLGLFFRQPRYRNAGPHADDFSDIVFSDNPAFCVLAFFPVLFQGVQVFVLPQFPVPQLRRRFVLLGGDGLVLLFADLF